MGLPDENRQCGICEQMVPSHTKGVEIMQFGKRRVFHEGCAKLVSEAYEKNREEYRMKVLKELQDGEV